MTQQDAEKRLVDELSEMLPIHPEQAEYFIKTIRQAIAADPSLIAAFQPEKEAQVSICEGLDDAIIATHSRGTNPFVDIAVSAEAECIIECPRFSYMRTWELIDARVNVLITEQGRIGWRVTASQLDAFRAEHATQSREEAK